MTILFYEKIVVGNYENDRMQRYMEMEKKCMRQYCLQKHIIECLLSPGDALMNNLLHPRRV